MSPLEIEYAGEKLALLSEKALYWPRARTVIVADLHLGKAAAFRQLGVAVPESTTLSDLDRLGKVMDETACLRLVILGDFFHAAAGCQPEVMAQVADWRGNHASVEMLLVAGNHDRKSGPPPAIWNIQNVEGPHDCPPFYFCHEPRKIRGGHVLAGHIHPAIELRERFGFGVRAPCFYFSRGFAILPAFGSFTGMRAVKFERGDRIFAIGREEVIEVTR